MPRFLRLFHSESEPVEIERDRSYTKHDAEYWQPTLAEQLGQHIAETGRTTYASLREWAAEQGYAPSTFYHAIDELHTDGKIDRDGWWVEPIEEDAMCEDDGQ